MPVSATNQWINLTGLAVLAVVSLGAIVGGINPAIALLLAMAGYAVPVAALEAWLLKVHRRPSTGLDWELARRRAVDWGRVRVKLIGLAGSVAAVAIAHWSMRFYVPAEMALAGSLALIALPVAAIVAIPYVALVDRAMREPMDGCWHMGNLLLGRLGGIDRRALSDHLLGWAIKGFFLPIMIVYLLKTLLRLQANVAWPTESFVLAVRWLADYAAALELAIVCTGYLCTFRLLDAHIRSPNRLLAGWVVTLACYEPFNRVVTGGVLHYASGREWHDWFGDVPALAVPWAVALLASFAIWIWATAAYGLRWSNLTHRGIITNGPYRFTKHPDYVAKSTFFWLVNVPFLSEGGPIVALKAMLLLGLFNLIYFGRARMEERHLSEDPDYVAYALAMNERSVFRGLARIVPGLRYRPPAGSAAGAAAGRPTGSLALANAAAVPGDRR